MIKTLAEKCPAAYEDLKKAGRPCIAEMMTRFTRPVDIDNALGIESAAAHWVAGRNGASKRSERLAAEWVAKQDAIAAGPGPIIQTTSLDGVFMVVCPADKAAKVSKVLDMMGCECVEI